MKINSEARNSIGIVCSSRRRIKFLMTFSSPLPENFPAAAWLLMT
jgi:hypothetical protein